MVDQEVSKTGEGQLAVKGKSSDVHIPKHFEMNDRHEVLAFLNANAFGQLISRVDGKLFASHIPFLINSEGAMLRAHLAKANPQWKDIQSEEVLVTFQGPHDYISPSWYRDPGVPTWNYQAVHVYGRCRTFHDAETLHNVVIELTQRYEANFPQPWQPEYKEGMLRGITGLEIEITDIQCIYKLSQNRSEADRAQVIQQLEGLGSKSLFEAMKKRG